MVETTAFSLLIFVGGEGISLELIMQNVLRAETTGVRLHVPIFNCGLALRCWMEPVDSFEAKQNCLRLFQAL